MSRLRTSSQTTRRGEDSPRVRLAAVVLVLATVLRSAGAADLVAPDQDGDGLDDEVETGTGLFVDASDTGSDPLDPDSDGDGLGDGYEVALGYDPNQPGEQRLDPDSDGLENLGEQAAGSDPFDPDSDDDDLFDMDEVSRIIDQPLSPRPQWGTNGNALDLHLLDLDRDGDLDAFALIDGDEAGYNEPDYYGWYENRAGGFVGYQRIGACPSNCFWAAPVDLDGDGDRDVLFSLVVADVSVHWHENRLDEPEADFAERRLLLADPIDDYGYRVVRPGVVDMDGDGDPDVVLSSDTGVGWVSNELDGEEPAVANAGVIAGPGRGSEVGDVDGDGDPDVLRLSEALDEIVLYESQQDATVWIPRSIAATEAGFSWIAAADLDADGDPDALIVEAGALRWLENRLDAGPADFARREVLIDSVAEWIDAQPADVDGDGRVDLVVLQEDHVLGWYANRLATEHADFDELRVLLFSAADGDNPLLRVGDLDLDGDPDFVTSDGHFHDGGFITGHTVAAFANPGSDPLDPDSDDDTLLDGEEVHVYGTNPVHPDSDGDEYDDGTEVAEGSDPLDTASIPSPEPSALALAAAALATLAVVRRFRASGRPATRPTP